MLSQFCLWHAVVSHPVMMVSAGAIPGFPFYQQQPVGGSPRRWPARLTGLPADSLVTVGRCNRPCSLGAKMRDWDAMWHPVMPQAGTMPMLQARPAPQVSHTAKFVLIWQEMTGWRVIAFLP